MIIIGLTGSIGMGKSTAANIFKQEFNIPVYDSDKTVHDLMDFNGAAVSPILTLFPEVLKTNNKGEKAIDRKKLGAFAFKNKEHLKQLENILHPMAKNLRDQFLLEEFNRGSKIVLLDTPLLFETGGEKRCDAVVVVNVSPETQKERVFARDKNMTEERFKSVLEKQMPNSEKCLKADFILSMEGGLDQAKADVKDILNNLKTLEPKAFSHFQKGLKNG